ncbi:exosome non-catalytic core subunit RRP46 [Pneumocystis jirovecii RU7]|uniref:Exoribonuclease phosphorolytic domain-containing protein n=1 Tax=Pneumocystis jirovecii (strain RU7) TaxID=1408657 RepID=A0A0W4ZRK6_PNEJ7|nr:exosome non-catalytic core subunit RRP46 [Pneumocystis jirovecii RU7]KTW31011.1 hypothetical protein T551_01563 [Pneumocystis jirovecii RU7]
MENIFFKTSLLTRVEGSCIYEEGPNKILCAVIGPSETKTRDEVIGEATIDVIVRPDVRGSSTKDIQMEQIIWKTISPMIMRTMYPHTLIQMVIQIISREKSENIVSLLAAILNTTFISLLDSGVAMTNTFSAVSLAVLSKEGETSIILNPSLKILNDATSSHVVCYAFPDEKLILCDSIGFFTENQFIEILSKALIACKDTHERIKATIIEKMKEK